METIRRLLAQVCLASAASILLGYVQGAEAQAVDPPAIGTPHATDSRFQTLTLDRTFQSEGATVADINGDGRKDVISGPYWYAGPDFKTRCVYAQEKAYSIKGYSDHFFTFAGDFNHDDQVDLLAIPIPGGDAYWFQNPGPKSVGLGQPWEKHLLLTGVGSESPTLVDLTGDASAELVCIHEGEYGYASPVPGQPYEAWEFTPISENRNLSKFTHGLGVGDVDGDGRPDLIEATGWWQQTSDPRDRFRFRPQRFAVSGGAQMFAYDFDGDGDNDILSVQNAHGYGISWFERRGRTGDDFLFVEHPILTDQATDNPHRLSLSQMHSIGLADIDGDGVKDIVTGKRYFAHGGKDPGAFELPMLVWLKTVRNDGRVSFHPHVVHLASGVGTQVTVDDIDRNGHVDLVVGNKNGTFVSFNSGEIGNGMTEAEQPYSLVGSGQMSLAVRETKPLSPKDEKSRFVLPDGFEIQLVAAEPDIAKPMNMAFDARGRLWVSSSEEYPYAAAGDEQASDTIKILEDTTGDGYADQVTTFADGLNIPIGLYPYGNGVICFSIPNVWYLQDTDGDGRADKRDVLYGPMDTSRDTHGMCNGFTRGFDGWLYACHGFNNQTTVASADGHEITMHSGNTFRMRVDGSRIEHFTHGQVNPFGIAMNPAGDLFSADCHTKPVSLLMRGGHYPSFGKPHDGLGFVPDVMQHLHGSTGIGGIALYHDDQFPAAFHGNSFGGNVMTSRVNRNSIRRQGSTIVATEEPDFLVSGDPWFRPVDLQVGPDGALYIADFYNGIIGHYEVPLDHPERDRWRGRIWKIVYTGASLETGSESQVAVEPKQTGEPTAFQQAVTDLSSASLHNRMHATEILIDHHPSEILRLIRSRALGDTNAAETIQMAWILVRLGQMDLASLESLAGSKLAVVRNHAFRIIESFEMLGPAELQILRDGMNDSDALVRRSAVMAAAKHPRKSLTKPLLDLYVDTPAQDVHLRHSIKLALKVHLANDVWFRDSTRNLSPPQIALVNELCLAVNSIAAGRFLVDHLDSVAESQNESLGRYLTFASRYADRQSLPELIELASSRFANDQAMQLSLMRAIRDGLQQRGDDSSSELQAWAHRWVAGKLGIDPGDDAMVFPDPFPVAWTVVSIDPTKPTGDCWTTSTRRRSADGQENNLLHSSFPNGEQRTGIIRSGVFSLPDRFEFYMAGHDGYPDQPPQKKNFVQLCDATTGEVLRSWAPPRNDTAQLFSWEPSQNVGREVYVQLVDGDSAGAYAWLAAGRFSVASLNPNRRVQNWRSAAEVVAEFKLSSMRKVMVGLLSQRQLDAVTAVHVANAVVAASDSATAVEQALAVAFGVSGLDDEMRISLLAVIERSFTRPRRPGDLADAKRVLMRVLSVASFDDQSRLAERLCSDTSGAVLLVELIESGVASIDLLRQSVVQTQLPALLDEADRKRFDSIRDALPAVNDLTDQRIAAKKSAVLRQRGDASQGAVIFQSRCGVCHQVAGVGKQVGPNLDGVGKRGLERLLDDVLVPSRNVDVAFQSSLVLTDDGKVYRGLLKQDKGQRRILVDHEGKEVSIDSGSIQQVQATALSAMPDNFCETLSDDAARDLFAYLLSI